MNRVGDRDTLGRSPGARRAPDHRIEITRPGGRWIVTASDGVLADSEDVLALDEQGYDRVLYFPPEDVRIGALAPVARRTTCPFKGEAHYFAAEIDGELRDVAWYYPRVYDEVAPIAGYVAFYADRVSIEEEDRG